MNKAKPKGSQSDQYVKNGALVSREVKHSHCLWSHLLGMTIVLLQMHSSQLRREQVSPQYVVKEKKKAADNNKEKWCDIKQKLLVRDQMTGKKTGCLGASWTCFYAQLTSGFPSDIAAVKSLWGGENQETDEPPVLGGISISRGVFGLHC